MNPWIVCLILRLLRGLVSDEVLQEINEKVVAMLVELAARTDNKIDDAFVELVARFLGVPVPAK